jgi:hypothetical protein
MVLSQLPDISLAEFNFLDPSLFSSQYGRCVRLPRVTDPTRGARGKAERRWATTESGTFQELGVLVKFGHPSRVDLKEALALRFINKMLPADESPRPRGVFGWKSTRDPG